MNYVIGALQQKLPWAPYPLIRLCLQFTHVPPLPAEVGCESRERIVLLLFLIA